jgi:hypothetical protein
MTILVLRTLDFKFIGISDTCPAVSFCHCHFLSLFHTQKTTKEYTLYLLLLNNQNAAEDALKAILFYVAG